MNNAGMTPSTTVSRLTFVDAYKAMLIGFVVLGHACQWTVSDFDGNLCVKFIYSCHMAAFYFLSGFVMWRGSNRAPAFLPGFLHLVIPFFAWWILSQIFAGGNFLDAFVNLIRQPDSGLWFLYVLAMCRMAYFACRQLAIFLKLPPDILLAAGCLGFSLIELLTGFNQYGFHFFAWYYIFFLAGYWLRKFGDSALTQVARWSHSNCAAYVLLGLWIILVPCWQRNTPITLPLFGTLPGVVAFGYRFLTAMCAIIGFFILFSKRKNYPPFILAIGRHTLGMYVLHGFLLAFLVSYLPIENVIVQIILLTPFAFVGSYILTRLLRRVPFIGPWIV